MLVSCPICPVYHSLRSLLQPFVLHPPLCRHRRVKFRNWRRVHHSGPQGPIKVVVGDRLAYVSGLPNEYYRRLPNTQRRISNPNRRCCLLSRAVIAVFPIVILLMADFLIADFLIRTVFVAILIGFTIGDGVAIGSGVTGIGVAVGSGVAIGSGITISSGRPCLQLLI